MNESEAKNIILKCQEKNISKEYVKKYNQAVRTINKTGNIKIKLSEMPDLAPKPDKWLWLITMNKTLMDKS